MLLHGLTHEVFSNKLHLYSTSQVTLAFAKQHGLDAVLTANVLSLSQKLTI